MTALVSKYIITAGGCIYTSRTALCVLDRTVTTATTMYIVVTGCNGSVGSQVVALTLRKGHRVHGIDHGTPLRYEFYKHPEFSYSNADLTDYTNVVRELKGAEAVIHLAGVPQPFDYLVKTHNT